MSQSGCNALSEIKFIDLKHQYQTIQPQIEFAIQEVLNHGQYILGPEVFELEAELASNSDAKYCVSCSSSTDKKDITDFALIVGNPGVVVDWVNRYGDKPSFDENGVSICPKSNEKYHLSNNQIKIVDE